MLINKKSSFIILAIAIILVLSIVIVYRVVFDNVNESGIISQFENNANKFMSIQKYAEETKGYLYVDNNSGELEMTNTGGENEVFDEKIKDEILFVIKKLGFVGIYESDEYIKFSRTIGNYPQGIIYLKKEGVPIFVLKNQKIRDKWYYYMTKNV